MSKKLTARRPRAARPSSAAKAGHVPLLLRPDCGTTNANAPADTDPRTILQTIAADPTTPASVRVNACRLLLSSSPDEEALRSDHTGPASDESHEWRKLVGKRGGKP